MQIFVRGLSGRTFTLEVSEDHDIDALKVLIQQVDGTPIDQQRLIWNGRLLERSLGFYGIKKEATLHLVLRLRGGMYHESSGY